MNASLSSPRPATPRVSRWEWAQLILLGGNLAWTTLANGGYGCAIVLVSVFLTTALLVVHVLAVLRAGAHVPRFHPAGLLFLPFLLYALANVLWVTPVHWLGWRDWLGWAQPIVLFWVALNALRSGSSRRALFYILIALGIIGVVFGCYQQFVRPEWRLVGEQRGTIFGGRASGSFGIPNSFAGYLVLLLPAVMALTLRRTASATARVWWGWVTLVLLFGLGLTVSRGAWLSLAVALVFWPLAAARGGWRRRIAVALPVLLVVAAVGALTVAQSPQAGQRFRQLADDLGEKTRPAMWRGAWQLFLDAPVFGIGAGSYNVLFERHRPEGFRDEPLWAHNEYLNTLSDYGLVGFLLFFGAVGFIGVRGFRAPRANHRPTGGLTSSLTVAGLATGLLAFALQMTLDFHLKIPALAFAAAVVAALTVGAVWPLPEGEAKSAVWRQATLGAVAILGLVAVPFFFFPMLRAEALRADARSLVNTLHHLPPEHPEFARRLQAAGSALQRATQFDQANAQAWADSSYVMVSLALVVPRETRELGQEAEAAANRALELSPVCSEFWIRRGVARNAQGRWLGAGSDFQKAVSLAPADATTWYYYADHLSRFPSTREAAEAALDFCLRLDPGNHPGIALRQRLAITTKTTP